MPQGQYLLQAVGGGHLDPVGAGELIGHPLDIHVRRLPLLGIHHVDAALLGLGAQIVPNPVGVKDQGQLTALDPLVVAEGVDQRPAGGVQALPGQTAQVLPSEDDVVAIHQKNILLLYIAQLLLRDGDALGAALAEGVHAPVADGAVGPDEDLLQFLI